MSANSIGFYRAPPQFEHNIEAWAANGRTVRPCDMGHLFLPLVSEPAHYNLVSAKPLLLQVLSGFFMPVIYFNYLTVNGLHCLNKALISIHQLSKQR